MTPHEVLQIDAQLKEIDNEITRWAMLYNDLTKYSPSRRFELKAHYEMQVALLLQTKEKAQEWMKEQIQIQ